MAGFGSSAVFGTFVGSLADKYGRRNFAAAWHAASLFHYSRVSLEATLKLMIPASALLLRGCTACFTYCSNLRITGCAVLQLCWPFVLELLEMLQLFCLRDCEVLSHQALQGLLDADDRAHHGRYCHIASFQCVAWTFWSLSPNSTYPRIPGVFGIVSVLV